jgi:hypothetical protein
MHINVRLLLVFVVSAGIAGAFAMSRGALAQQSANITVSAGVSSALTLTTCDTTANFGNGLTALGGTPTGTTDQVLVSEKGNMIAGQGVFYIWTPSCPAGQKLFTIESTLPWLTTECGGENTGTSSLSVAQGDLGWTTATALQGNNSYAFLDGSDKFRTPCPVNSGVIWKAGVWTLDLRYLLRVDFGDRPGTFNSTTTWTVSV